MLHRFACRPLLMLAPITLLGLASAASADLIQENFNDYGSTTTDLRETGSVGGGWSGGWDGDVAPKYAATTQLTFSNANYSNTANQTGADDGAAAYGSGNAANIVSRNFSASMTSTIWVSTLIRYTSSNADALIWFDSNDFISIRNREAILRYNGGNIENDTTIFGVDTTHLLLAKIIINASGINDAVSFWVKSESDDLSSEAALGAPIYTRNNADALGNGLSQIRLSFEDAGTTLDQLRISNNPNAFQEVLGVPEPASLALMAIGGLFIVHRKR